MINFLLEKTKIAMIHAVDTELYLHGCNLFCDKDFKIRASCGHANRTSVPWILRQSHFRMTE